MTVSDALQSWDLSAFLQPSLLDKDMTDNSTTTQGQMPTPPLSDSGQSERVASNLSVSTVFYYGAPVHFIPPNVVLLSSDNVLFYVNSAKLQDISENRFGAVLDLHTNEDNPINVPDASDVVNIILHTVYDLSPQAFAPTAEQLSRSVDRMPYYGMNPKTVIVSSPLYNLLLSLAPLYPIDMYAIAAKYDISELAVPVSAHLLSYPLSSLTEEMSKKIGARYLRRLFFMHFGRVEALKRLLLSPPFPHPPTPNCDFSDQKSLTRAWSLTAAYLVWDARPDTSTSTIKAAFTSLGDQISCRECKQALDKRLIELIVGWSQIKTTI